MLATGSQTVLVFKKIQFQGDWTRSNGANVIIYTANKKAKLVVVVETEVGTDATYSFNANQNDDVWVCYGGDAQVHIPTLCVSSQPGDQFTCKG